MPPDETVDFARLTDLLTPWAVRVAATLRVADLIRAGTTRVDELATAVDADADALARLLRYLACRGLFAEPEPGVFALTDAITPLLSDHPASRRARLDLDGMGGRIDGASAGLLQAVRTGEPPYAAMFGHPFWDDISANPGMTPSFDEIMADHLPWFGEVVRGYDWSGVKHVVDVGGGTGTLLAAILKAHPHVEGTLVDQAATVVGGAAHLAEHGLADRGRAVAGSFFDPLPTGGDVYVLSNILHDWNDEDAVRILHRCAEAAGPRNRTLIADRVVDVNGDRKLHTLLDLRMLVLLGGRERTYDEWLVLTAKAGLRVRNTSRRGGGVTLLECVAA